METKQVVNGTSYGEKTPPEVIRILEDSRHTGRRLRLHYGDPETGRDWLDEWGMTGKISRSMGPEKIPIIISSSRAVGGGGILDSCVVRVRAAAGGAELYRHPLYHQATFTTAENPAFPDVPFEILADGKPHARFATAEKRAKWLRKMGTTL